MAAGVPAVQIAVSHRGQIIYSEAFGMTGKETATAATPRSVMQIASITKQFTAAAILRLAERGALTLVIASRSSYRSSTRADRLTAHCRRTGYRRRVAQCAARSCAEIQFPSWHVT
jgi:hypothetical protein